MVDWWIGLAGSVTIAGLAYWRKSLSWSGAVTAIIVGTLLYALGTAQWFVPLIAFFLSSSLLSKWKQKRKETLESGYEKGSRRDVGQVLANGGLGAFLCIIHAWFPHPLWLAAFAGIMASVTADTWATEIGGLSRKPPRSILTGQQVSAGTSGGVTILGLIAAACGGLFIGLIVALLGPSTSHIMLFIPIALLAGSIGALADSYLGATVQRMNRCVVCNRELEAAFHCGKPSEYHKGYRWLNNDAVNMLSSVVGGLVSVGLFSLIYLL